MGEQRVTLPITGMHCANCVLTVERSLKKAQGVSDAAVNFATEQATVSFDPLLVKPADLVKRVEDAGYGVMSARVGALIGFAVVSGRVVGLAVVEDGFVAVLERDEFTVDWRYDPETDGWKALDAPRAEETDQEP